MTLKAQSFYARASAFSFKGLEFIDRWIGLSQHLSDTLHYRKNWANYAHNISIQTPTQKPVIWIHGASVGELEDLAAFYTDRSALHDCGLDYSNIVLTGSSVSTEDYFNKQLATLPLLYKGPLPPEDQSQMKVFIQRFQPDLLILSHQDLWPTVLESAGPQLKHGIFWLPSKAPLTQSHFKTKIQRRSLFPWLRAVGSRLHTQDPNFKQAQQSLPCPVHSIGNPRIDRVLSRIRQAPAIHVLTPWGAQPRHGDYTLNVIIGSAWPEDAQVLAEALQKFTVDEQKRLFIVAIPHETRNSHAAASIQTTLPQAQVVITRGVLVEAYRDFDVAFVGGGFRTGLHSLLEPALLGLPLICGPLTNKQSEASQLIKHKQLHKIHNSNELYILLKSILDTHQLQNIKSEAKQSQKILLNCQGSLQRLVQQIKTILAV